MAEFFFRDVLSLNSLGVKEDREDLDENKQDKM